MKMQRFLGLLPVYILVISSLSGETNAPKRVIWNNLLDNTPPVVRKHNGLERPESDRVTLKFTGKSDAAYEKYIDIGNDHVAQVTNVLRGSPFYKGCEGGKCILFFSKPDTVVHVFLGGKPLTDGEGKPMIFPLAAGTHRHVIDYYYNGNKGHLLFRRTIRITIAESSDYAIRFSSISGSDTTYTKADKVYEIRVEDIAATEDSEFVFTEPEKDTTLSADARAWNGMLDSFSPVLTKYDTSIIRNVRCRETPRMGIMVDGPKKTDVVFNKDALKEGGYSLQTFARMGSVLRFCIDNYALPEYTVKSIPLKAGTYEFKYTKKAPLDGISGLVYNYDVVVDVKESNKYPFRIKSEENGKVKYTAEGTLTYVVDMKAVCTINQYQYE